MKDERDKNALDAYWKYLEENSKVVSRWPAWLKGERALPSESSCSEKKDLAEDERLAS